MLTQTATSSATSSPAPSAALSHQPVRKPQRGIPQLGEPIFLRRDGLARRNHPNDQSWPPPPRQPYSHAPGGERQTAVTVRARTVKLDRTHHARYKPTAKAEARRLGTLVPGTLSAPMLV
jgi:hypothetical protein